MKPLNLKFIDGAEQARAIILHALSFDYDVKEADPPSVVFFADDKRAMHRQYQDCLKIYTAVEYTYPNFNQCDYALSYLNLPTSKNLRLPYYTWQDCGAELLKENDEWQTVIREKKKFCSFIASNGNPKRTWKRIYFFNQLSQYKRVDSGGRALNNIGYQVADKIAFCRPYKFAITIENQSKREYTTEKIVHAMMSRCIPIYWGNPEVVREFNPKSFINLHDFKNDAEAIEHIIRIDQNPVLLAQYLREPFFHDNQMNEWFDLERLRSFLVRAIESPRERRALLGYLPFRWMEIKKLSQPYYDKVRQSIKTAIK